MKENRQEQMAPALRGNHPWKDFIPCKEASTLSMWQKPDWMTDTGRVNQIKTVWQQAHKNPQKQKLPSGWLSHYASAIRSRSQFWDRAPQWGSLPRRKPVSPSHTLRAYVPLSLFHSQINLKKIKQAKKKKLWWQLSQVPSLLRSLVLSFCYSSINLALLPTTV